MALSDDAPGGEKTGQPVSDPLSGANPGEPDVCFEGLPLLSLLAAAVFSFVVLWKTPSLAYPILAAMAGPGSNGGPLLLPFFMGGWLETLLGPVVLTVASLILHVAQGHYRFPDWLPFAFSVPVAVGLLAPSALEYGGSSLDWLAFSLLAAAIFCLHWKVFTYARLLWD